MPPDANEALPNGPPRQFATTQWSIVLAAGGREKKLAGDALARLCESYWYPLYAYIRQRIPHVHEAQDLTQAFFVYLLDKQTIAHADPNRGRFRAFLLTALKNFLANEWDKARAAKRGGERSPLSLDLYCGESKFQIELSHDLTPERLYERRWVLTLLDQVLESLRSELIQAGKEDHFEIFKGAITQEATAEDYDKAAQALGLSPAAAKQAAYRLRKRYRELFRAEVARTLGADENLDLEISRLLECLG